MNSLLWLIQIPLSLLFLAGGAYKVFTVNELASQIPAIPPGLWLVVGVIEFLGGIFLIVPTATRWKPKLTPLAATVLTVEGLALTAVYAQYSTEIAVTNPMVWSLAMALLVAFVAYGRWQTP